MRRMRGVMLVAALVAAACAAPAPTPASRTGGTMGKPNVTAEAPLDLHGDAHALVGDAFAARARGDAAGARRTFERVRLIAEATAGVRAQVVPAEDFTSPQSGAPWSPDGRYAVYEHGSGSSRGLLVVDTHTWTSLRIDSGSGAMFSDDGAYVAVSGDQTVSAYELATGRTVLEAARTTMRPSFLAGGKLVWANIDGNDDVVYLRDLAGSQITLRAPRPAASQSLTGIRDVILAAPDRLIAWGYAPGGEIPLHVFSIPERRLLVSFESKQNTAKVVGDRMYYVRKQGQASQLRFVGLRDPAHDVPQPASANKKCGAGLFDERTRVLQCSPEQIVVAHDHTACEWELSTGKLTRTWPTGPNPEPACDRKQLPPPRRPGMMPMPMPSDMLGDLVDIEGTKPEVSFAKLEDSKHATGFAASPNGALVAGLVLDDADFTRAPKHGDVLDSSSGFTGGRPRIWSAAGNIVWTAPAPSGATSVAVTPNGDLVLASRDGRVWHIASAARGDSSRDAGAPLRTTPPPLDCALSDFGVLPDGRAAMFCRGVEQNEVLRIEGGEPLVDTPRYNAAARIATSSTAASAMIASDAGLSVYSLPSGKVLWTSDAKNRIVPAHYDLNATTLAPSGDRMALQSRGALALVDHDNVLWQKDEGLISPLTFSPDGALVVTQPWQGGDTQVRDAATGTVVDTLPGAAGSVAFASGNVLVYVRRVGELATGDATIVLRDVRTKRELGTRTVPSSIAAYLESLAATGSSASPTIAAVDAAGIALVWGADAAPRLTISAGGGAVTLASPDGTIRLLGDANAAREHLACRIGSVLFPFEVCEGRLLPP